MGFNKRLSVLPFAIVVNQFLWYLVWIVLLLWRNLVLMQNVLYWNRRALWMIDHIEGISVLRPECSHEKVKSFRAIFDNEQWKVISNHNNQAIVVGAKFVDGVLDVSAECCAILPFDRIAKDSDENKLVTYAEMFAGGFSGWNFAAKGIQKKGFHLQHQWSIDKDPECREAFVHTHHPDVVAITRCQFWTDFHAKTIDGDHCSVFVHAPISERWWLTAFPHELDLLVASPPCPPWAVTNHAPGFARSDGLTFLEMMQYCAWIRPRVLVIENIASITKHAHWNIILAIFCWAHYEVKGFHNLNLLDHCPQQRERMILIAVDLNDDSDTGYVFEKWLIGKFLSLKNYHAILADGYLERLHRHCTWRNAQVLWCWFHASWHHGEGTPETFMERFAEIQIQNRIWLCFLFHDELWSTVSIEWISFERWWIVWLSPSGGNFLTKICPYWDCLPSGIDWWFVASKEFQTTNENIGQLYFSPSCGLGNYQWNFDDSWWLIPEVLLGFLSRHHRWSDSLIEFCLRGERRWLFDFSKASWGFGQHFPNIAYSSFLKCGCEDHFAAVFFRLFGTC